jgi:hypothetical protein
MAALHEAKTNPSDKSTLQLQSRILQFGNLALEGVGRKFVPESLVSIPEEPVAKKVKKEQEESTLKRGLGLSADAEKKSVPLNLRSVSFQLQPQTQMGQKMQQPWLLGLWAKCWKQNHVFN